MPLGRFSQAALYTFFIPTRKKDLARYAKSLFLLDLLLGPIGLEPTTPTMSRWCSNQLSYAPESLFDKANYSSGFRLFCAYNHKPAPAAIIGKHNHWPMLRPSDKSPRKSSGSRKNSAPKRRLP